MTSIMTAAHSPITFNDAAGNDHTLNLNELNDLHAAVEPFTSSIIRSGQSSVHLYCKVPTWSHSDTCMDLHDLHELRSRLLLFIPSLLRSLRSSGVKASYSLAPSDTSLCVVCAFPPQLSSQAKAAAAVVLQEQKCSKREKAILVDMDQGPALIIT
ncbi:hypothetical protein BDV98DRAFT_570653 [Pterulicium gracile]|uniref:Uncharacterized protein n=1 Tax=Pterulicium gracile TaxID=1884261 RepID=A0A5C3QGQ1_9AGAR|nr:hypothetical protein BDV98DRAFT_570653 [Pterula gracilis]